MPGSEHDKVLGIAADQLGYVTTAQAAERGVSADAIRMMAKRNALERVSRGVYRVPTFPTSPYASYMEASLWPARSRGVICHESALALYGLSDANPTRIHITVPKRFRIRREIPRHLRVHHGVLGADEIRLFEAIPVTTPVRTIRDCYEVGVGPSLLRQAIDDAQREGYLSRSQADSLRSELLTEKGAG